MKRVLIAGVSILFLLLGILSQPLPAQNSTTKDNPWERGKLRMYGWITAPVGIQPGDFTIEQLREMGVNLAWGSDWLLMENRLSASDLATYQSNITRLHDLGIRVAAKANVVRVVWETFYRDYPEATGHVLRDSAGNPMKWHDRPHENVANLLDPYWWNMHRERVTLMIEAGFDLIHWDNPWVVVAQDKNSRKAWESYAHSVLGEDHRVENARPFKTIDNTQIPYNKWPDINLRARTVLGVETEDSTLAAVYKSFKYDLFIREMEKLREHAKQLNPDVGFDFTAHLTSKDLYYWTFGRDAYDLICIENGVAQSGWFVPEGQDLFAYKLAYAAGMNKPVWLLTKFSYSREMREKLYGSQWRQVDRRIHPSPDREELYLAEAVASEGVISPLTAMYSKEYGNYSNLVSRYYSFMRDRERELSNTRSVAKIGVVVSARSFVFHEILLKPVMFGTSEFLMRHHYPYDVLVAENLDQASLEPYDILITLHTSVLSESITEKIKNHVEKGAILLAVGEIGTHRENYTPRKHKIFPLPQNSQQAGVRLGKGRTIRLPFSPSLFRQKYIEDSFQHGKEAHYLLNFLSEHATSLITVRHEGASRIVVEPRQKDRSLICHFLNFNYSIFPDLLEAERFAKEVAIPQDNVCVTVNRSLALEPRSVTLLIPGEKPVSLPFEKSEAHLSFEIPELRVYAMIEIS